MGKYVKISAAEQIPPITPDTTAICFSDFGSFPEQAVNHWLIQNLRPFYRFLLPRFQRILLSDFVQQAKAISGNPAISDQTHIVVLHLQTLPLPYPEDKPLQFVPPMAHICVYCNHAFPDFSCHEAIFGERMLVELPVREKSFLQFYNEAGPELQTRISAFLLEHRQIVSNPYYTIIQRKDELMQVTGKKDDPKVIILPTNGQYSPREHILTFLGNPHEPTGKDDFIPCVFGDLPFFYAMMLCCGLRVSADYVLVQDYSRVAAIGGELLPDKDKDTLSAFLCCAPEARDNLLGAMFYAAATPLETDEPVDLDEVFSTVERLTEK